MEKLCPFTPDELQLMLSGEQVPQWTREDIMNYTEPKFGYTRETPGFQRFVNVLVNMSGDERKVIMNLLKYFSTADKHKLIGLQDLTPYSQPIRGKVFPRLASAACIFCAF